MTPNPRVILLGLDGAIFDLLGPWAQRGFLPTFAKILQEGTHGLLESTTPPITPSAWTTCCTGVTPEYHSIYDFLTSFQQNPAFAVVNSSMICAPRIWDLPGFREKRSLLLNVPYTYPLTPLNGIAVAGLPIPPGSQDFCYPPELRPQLERTGSPLRLNVDIPEFDVESLTDARRLLEAVERMFACRCRLFRYLYAIPNWDFFMAVFVFFDRVQHLFWKILDPATEAEWHDARCQEIRDRVLKMAVELDGLLSEVLKDMKPQDTLLIVSDHGFGPTERWLNVNTLLSKAGLLTLTSSANRYGKLFYRAMKLGESRAAQVTIPPRVRSAVRRRLRSRRSTFRSDLAQAIDWTHTQAFFASIPSQGIYLNVSHADRPGTVQRGLEYRRVRDQVLDLLRRESDRAGVQLEYLLKEERSGPCAFLAPDIHFRLDNFRLLGRPLPGATAIWDEARKSPVGFHRPQGVLMAWGAAVRSGGIIADARMLDVAPTLFQALSLPIPSHLQGKVLQALWKTPHPEKSLNVAPEWRRTPQRFTAASEAKIMSELKSQGYFE